MASNIPRILALPNNVNIPSTPSTLATHTFIHSSLDTTTYNHVMRSTLFGSILASKLPKVSRKFDQEAHACAAMMHDLAWNATWDKTKEFVSADKRFEVDGAIAAVNLLESLPDGWGDRKKQLVWDAIALHATTSISWYKEPEVMLTSYGIMVDFVGPNAAVFPQGPSVFVKQEEYESVIEQFPRLDLCGYVKEVCCGLCRVKPQATYDSFVGDFGDMFLREEGIVVMGSAWGISLLGSGRRWRGLKRMRRTCLLMGKRARARKMPEAKDLLGRQRSRKDLLP
jgi:hypothetical protein